MAVTHSLSLTRASSQYASISQASSANLHMSTSQTWEAWVRPSSLPGFMYIMGKVDSGATQYSTLSLNSSGKAYFELQGLTAGGTGLSNWTVTAGVWVHLAGVYNSSTNKLQLYVNGELDKDTSITGSVTIITSSWSIGRGGDYNGNYYDGLIRNARVWNVARTQAQIRADMNVDTPSDTTGLQGNWLLNNNYTDSSSNGYNLTASGSPTFSTTYPDALDLTENGTFLKKHKITIDNTKVSGSSDLTDVPIVLTESNFLADAFSNSQGQEINSNKLVNDANLVAYYRMESGALTTDSSGGGNTLTNNNTVSDGTGKFGGAADFGATNTNKYLSIANDLGIGGNEAITVSIWFKLYSTTGTQVIFQHSSTTGASRYFQMFNSGGTLNFDSGGGGGTGSATISAGVWYHAVFTRTAAGVCASYLNGVQTGVPVTSTGVNGVHFNIGVDTSNYASMLADDVAVFDRVLSAEEVRSLYAGGQDLRFSSDIDGKTRLAHEIVSWDTVNSTAEVHVKVNTLSYNTNTDIYCHYGNASATALDENEAFGKHQVYESNWKWVGHLQGNSTDSTRNNFDGTDTSATYGTSYGKIGQGIDYSGSSSFTNIGNAFDLTGNFTMFMFFNADVLSGTQFLIGKDHSTGTRQFAFGLNGTGFQIERAGTPIIINSGKFSTDTWYGIAIRYDGTNIKTYIAGSEDASSAMTALPSSTLNINLGRRQYTGAESYFNGSLDNVMIYSGSLSADYIATLYNNQNSPATFATPSAIGNTSAFFMFL